MDKSLQSLIERAKERERKAVEKVMASSDPNEIISLMEYARRVDEEKRKIEF